MVLRERVQRFGEHHNGFGFLRLLFASLVIVSHTPELVDGNRSREILSQLFGTLSFGELAVDCFFLISGFLITGSWLKNPHVLPYLRKRIARIYPAFVVCSIICVLVVAPMGGASLHAIMSSALTNVRLVATLDPPTVAGAFAGSPHQWLNGSAWTISYEFRCYLLVVILGWLGLLNRRIVLAALAVFLFAAYALVPPAWVELSTHIPQYNLLFANLKESLRLTAVFVVGALFFLNRERITFNPIALCASVLMLLAGLMSQSTADAAVAVFGGYLVIIFAHQAPSAVTAINNRNDASYGLYLYAWPVEKLLLRYFPGLTLLVLGTLTFFLSYALGWVSWLLIEKPFLKRFGSKPGRPNGGGSSKPVAAAG